MDPHSVDTLISAMSGAAALVAATAAAGAIWVGHLQVRALRQQNRIAIFDRRHAVFVRARRHLELTIQRAKPSIDDIMEFNRILQEARFIFPKNVSDKIIALKTTVLSLRSLHSQIWDDAGDPLNASSDLIDAFYRTLESIANEWEGLYEVFGPHMQLDA